MCVCVRGDHPGRCILQLDFLSFSILPKCFPEHTQMLNVSETLKVQELKMYAHARMDALLFVCVYACLACVCFQCMCTNEK